MLRPHDACKGQTALWIPTPVALTHQGVADQGRSERKRSSLLVSGRLRKLSCLTGECARNPLLEPTRPVGWNLGYFYYFHCLLRVISAPSPTSAGGRSCGWRTIFGAAQQCSAMSE